MLNDDDALELFKKTLPSGAAALVQMETTTLHMQKEALAVLRAARSRWNAPQLDFIALALHGKKAGFEKVIVLIDNMVENLKKEQQDDDDKKDTERAIADFGTKIADTEEAIATLTDEIKA